MLLSMVAVSLSLAILSAILIMRRITVGSTVESYGRVWTTAVLSEYDRHLFRDYGIMAFYGNNPEVARKVQYYLDYSLTGNLQIRSPKCSVELNGYELSDVENFRKALENSFGAEALEAVWKKSKRKERSRKDGHDSDTDSTTKPREIRNPVVLRTLPSKDAETSMDTEKLIEIFKSRKYTDAVGISVKEMSAEAVFIRKYFGSALQMTDEKEHYFENEWEYIIKGAPNDETNRKSCHRRIFLIRNALNLAYLYSDSEKVELVTSIAEIISPGPMGIVTQGILMEAWAALEAERDVEDLMEGQRVPVMKTTKTWKTGIQGILNDDEMKKKLDEDSQKLLKEKNSEVREVAGEGNLKKVDEGLTYEDYLMVLILVMPSDVRTLRIMDLVQINMKFRYYRDFNLAEYYGGVDIAIEAAGKKHSFRKEYR